MSTTIIILQKGKVIHDFCYLQDKNIISLVYNDQPPATESQPDILQSVADMYSKRKRGNVDVIQLTIEILLIHFWCKL